MNLKQALARIEALEKEVSALKARPAQHIHYHTHPAQQYAPLLNPPQYPQWPYRPGDIYCGMGGIGAGVSGPVVGIPQNAQ